MGKTTAAPSEYEAMITPAMAGPITRARLNCPEFRAMALTIASGGTRDGTNACQVGPFNAKANPWPNVKAMTANNVAWCSHASVARVAASTIMKLWVTRRIRLLSSRSVYTPPMGESTVGMKFTNVTKDTQKAE